jgi:hypothetical protein
VIGRDAGARLQRLPSSVYWAGLGSWGIRRFPGSIDSYFSSIRALRKKLGRVRENDDDRADTEANHVWHPALPPAPNDLLERTAFRLTTEEAEFVVDRLVADQRGALLTLLAQQRINADCEYIWEHPNLADFPTHLRELVNHAKIFSSVMHGAALNYNLQLSELREQDDWISYYKERLGQWVADIDMPAVCDWSLDDFWVSVAHPTHTIKRNLKIFVAGWLDLVRAGAAATQDLPAARLLVRDREVFLKRAGQSRFLNSSVRNRWRGASGAERLGFRWSQAKSHLWDLANAQ